MNQSNRASVFINVFKKGKINNNNNNNSNKKKNFPGKYRFSTQAGIFVVNHKHIMTPTNFHTHTHTHL